VIELLASNWLLIAALVLFVLMHRSGHGCGTHGGHGGHAHDGHSATPAPPQPTQNTDPDRSTP
jgi:preprotein translocase subunit SecG